MSHPDWDNLTGLYETKLISEGIHAAWFSEKKVLGVEFSEYFKPIPIVTIALFLTVLSVSCDVIHLLLWC